MSKVENRKQYKHSVDLIKYSEDGKKKRCNLCVEEFDVDKLQSSGYCTSCWADYQRLKRNGTLEKHKLKFQHKWEYLKEKYQNVKKCNTCLEIKSKKDFYPDKKSPHGYQNKCIHCVKKYNKINGYKPERDRKYQNNRRKNDINYRLKDVMGTSLNNYLHSKKQNKVINYLGCTINELKTHLKNQFVPEMNWDNYGDVWEIDHIIPVSSFDFTVEDNIFKCWNFSNLQPLFKTTEIAESFGYINKIGNRNKSNKLI
jgi:hypothetical protein